MKSFSSLACRQPAKIRKSCDGCAASNIKCGRQHPPCQSCLERSLACSFTKPRGSEKPCPASSKGSAWPDVEISASSPQYHAQNVTAAEPLSSWSEAATETCSCGNDKPKFGVPAFVDALNHCTVHLNRGCQSLLDLSIVSTRTLTLTPFMPLQPRPPS